MTSKELVTATLDFQGPERLARSLWLLPIAYQQYEQEIKALQEQYPSDVYGVWRDDPLDHPDMLKRGTFTDGWGCEWVVLQDGMVGEVKRAPLADYANLATYEWPFAALDQGWEQTDGWLREHQDKFFIGNGGDPFERMQFLRGTENVYMDLAEDCEELYLLRDKLFDYYREQTERMLQYDRMDGVQFSDDWGSQRSLLISPAKWREFFKPKYRELFALVKDAGKKIFFHSDGYILDIYPDLIELGVDALNSQLWCMGLEALKPFVGQITFWGELDRQHVLPHGTPEEIREQARQMVMHLYRNGGLIGHSSIEQVWHLENVEAALSGWDEIPISTRRDKEQL